MTTDEQNKDLQSSQPGVIQLPSNGSGAETAGKGVASSSHVRGVTGPRTAQGKKRSKQNSLKHGILAKAAVLKGESQAEFDVLLSGLREDFQPVGTLEESLVETLAVTLWRQRRLLVAEGAEIQAGQTFIEWNVEQRDLDEAAKLQPGQSRGGLVAQISNPKILEECLSHLQILKTGVQTGVGSDDAYSILGMLYGLRYESPYKTLFRSYDFWRHPDYFRKNGGHLSVEECKKAFLCEIDQEIERLATYRLERSSIRANRIRVEALRRSVPDSPRLDGLLRYGATLERTLDRTLNQLERLQRMRRGQPVPPQINVNLSSS